MIDRSHIMRGAEDSMVQFNAVFFHYVLFVTDRSTNCTILSSVPRIICDRQIHKLYHIVFCPTYDNLVQFMDLSVTKNTWGRRQYGTVYGSVGHKKYVGQKTIWNSLWICRSQKIINCTILSSAPRIFCDR
jgi:hypothetical protein